MPPFKENIFKWVTKTLFKATFFLSGNKWAVVLDILVYTCAYIPTIDKRKSRLRIFFNYIAVRAVLHTKFTEKNYKIKTI